MLFVSSGSSSAHGHNHLPGGKAEHSAANGLGWKEHHLPHSPLQEEHLKPITTKTLDLKPVGFARFLEVLLTVAGLVVFRQRGMDISWCLAGQDQCRSLGCGTDMSKNPLQQSTWGRVADPHCSKMQLLTAGILSASQGRRGE